MNITKHAFERMRERGFTVEMLGRILRKKNLRRIPSKKDDVSKIIAEIDNAPTVEYTFEEAFQKTVCENKLYCPSRQKGEWRYVIRSNFPQYEPICRCSICKGIGGKLDKFCKHCGADMRGNEK